jgi:hypothetical protein
MARRATKEGEFFPASIAGGTHDHDCLGRCWARQCITATAAPPTPAADESADFSKSGREALPSDALLQLLDPGLERRHVVLQFLQAPLQDLALHPLISQHILNTVQRLEDRLILLFEALQSPVKMIEVREDFPEPLIVLGQLGVNTIEAMVDGFEAAADLLELSVQEIDELLVFVIGHAQPLSAAGTLNLEPRTRKPAFRSVGEIGEPAKQRNGAPENQKSRTPSPRSNPQSDIRNRAHSRRAGWPSGPEAAFRTPHSAFAI